MIESALKQIMNGKDIEAVINPPKLLLSDQTEIAKTTWALLKKDAMKMNYTE